MPDQYREIPLTRGYVAKVDEADYEYLSHNTLVLTQGKTAQLCAAGYAWASQWKWCYLSRGYAVRTISYIDDDGKRRRDMLYLHVELAKRFGIYEAGKTVDHIDRNPLNNSLSNLRAATQSEQNRNRGKCRGSASKYKGVSLHRPTNKWQARIKIASKKHSLGYFSVEEEAALAYAIAAYLYHGEFACADAFDDEQVSVTQEPLHV